VVALAALSMVQSVIRSFHQKRNGSLLHLVAHVDQSFSVRTAPIDRVLTNELNLVDLLVSVIDFESFPVFGLLLGLQLLVDLTEDREFGGVINLTLLSEVGSCQSVNRNVFSAVSRHLLDSTVDELHLHLGEDHCLDFIE